MSGNGDPSLPNWKPAWNSSPPPLTQEERELIEFRKRVIERAYTGEAPPWPIQHQYGPALAGVYWQQVTEENCPSVRVLSIFDFTFAAGVDVANSSTAPGKLWDATIEYIQSMCGCVALKWASRECDSCVLILWEDPLSWKSFQESLGFVRLAPLAARQIEQRAVMVGDLATLGSSEADTLWRIETNIEADLNPQARIQFEAHVGAVVDRIAPGSRQPFASGWIEHTASASYYATEEDNAKVKTQCTYIMLFGSGDNEGCDSMIAELVENMSQIPLLTDVKKECVVKPIMAYHDSPEPPPPQSAAAIRPQAITLAEVLTCPMRRSALNVQLQDLEQAHVPDYSCSLISPREFGQGYLYRRDCTWKSEAAREHSNAEYCEVLARFVDASSYVDALPRQQAVPWMRRPNADWVGFCHGRSSRTEVITFHLPQDVHRKELFEQTFHRFQEIIRGRTQSGHAPEPCTLMEAGGWAPPSTHHGFNEESEDVFTCFLDWEMEEARAAWYHNLINSVMAYDEIGRCMDELKMLAECGVESRIILAKDRF